ncbi:MAG: diaminopimelate decarboxylase [Actinomycetota bacterium]|nr:diaminopimelate decarboxylase [Actinomycetota bacterium]
MNMPTGISPWPSSAAFDEAGLSIGGTTAEALAERFGTPLVVIDEEHLRARCREFRPAFPHLMWAVKAFPLRAVIRLVLDEGLGLLAATGGEVDACLRAGAPADRIVLHGNNKSEREIDEAVEARLLLVILDNGDEVARVGAAAERARVRQPVLLRVAPGIDVDAHAYVKTAVPETKFGTPVAGGLALDALRTATEHRSLDVRGIHLHLGSQLLDPRPYLTGIEASLDVLAEAREAFGFQAAVLDVGGGMGTRYVDEVPVPPADLARRMIEALGDGCRRRGLAVPELIVEPGRAVTSGSAVTLYRVGTIKQIPGRRTYVAVDGGMSDNIRPALYGSRYTMALASRASPARDRNVTVVGRHCESGDELGRDVPLPEDLGRDDLLAVASTGAYEYAMASTYNKVGRPAVVMVGSEGPRLVARREDYEDLARLDMDEPAGTVGAGAE